MSKLTSIALVGIGGYAANYLTELFENPHGRSFKWVGVIDPFAAQSPRYEDIQKRNIPICDTLDQFYQSYTADLVVIVTPIQLHCPQTCQALENGSNVLCEKPVAATVQEVDRMIKTRDQAKKSVAIGYQWSFSRAIQSLKQDILNGLLGQPRRLKSMTLWPRDYTYYGRNRWAGRIKSQKGDWILDSPINNATAHYIHNMLYILGQQTDRSAIPLDLEAELYRANDIENCDTAAIRAHTANGVEILYYATHAGENNIGPILHYEFEKGTVKYDPATKNLIVHFADGSTKDYGDPFDDHMNKLWHTVDAINNNTSVHCGLEAARAQTLFINGAQDSASQIVDFPKDLVTTIRPADESLSPRKCVSKLDETITTCFEQNLLPHEANISWSKAGKTVNLQNYQKFPGG